VVICLEQGADLHTAQLMPLPLTVSCSSKIEIRFTFLVLAQLGSPGKRAIKRVCVMLTDLPQARIIWEGCSRKGIWHKNEGMMEVGAPLSGWGGIQTDCRCVCVCYLSLHRKIQKMASTNGRS